MSLDAALGEPSSYTLSGLAETAPFVLSNNEGALESTAPLFVYAAANKTEAESGSLAESGSKVELMSETGLGSKAQSTSKQVVGRGSLAPLPASSKVQGGATGRHSPYVDLSSVIWRQA